MPLFFADGEAFAVGAAPYEYRPATSTETSPRIVLTVAVENYETSALVDTGGLYFICAPPLARRLHLDPSQAILVPARIRWRDEPLTGLLYRLPLTLQATEGESVTIEATAFVPQLSPAQDWNEELPCVLGMQGCLERMRFAVDPEREVFYFGELGEQR
jgi:hypothetical protein